MKMLFRPHPARPLLALTLLGLLGAQPAATQAQTQPPLAFHVSKILPKILDEYSYYPDSYSALPLINVNGQGYLLLSYQAAGASYGTPAQALVYTPGGQTILLPSDGLSLGTSKAPVALSLSDLAADGSFWVAGYYDDDQGKRRGVDWNVGPDGTPAAPVSLSNLVLPPDSQAPGEQASGGTLAVNSSGFAVGSGSSYMLGVPLTWQLPDPTPTRADEPGYTGSLFAVDESGNFVGESRGGDAISIPSFNGVAIPVPLPTDGTTHPEGQARGVKNGLAVGYYYRDGYTDYKTTATLGFVYDSASGLVTTLPSRANPGSGPDARVSEVVQINALGDIVGSDYNSAQNAPVLWKRQPDGSYVEYLMSELTITQPSTAFTLDFSNVRVARFLDDGSLVVNNVTQSAPYRQQQQVTVILQPGVGNPAHPAFFAGEVALTGGAYYLQFASGNPFGYYSYLTDPKYIYHFDLGYEYLFDAGDSRSGIYFYDFKSNGFFYTSPSFPFPYLYDFALNSTVYYYPDPSNPGRYNTDGTRYFYVFSTGKIISK